MPKCPFWCCTADTLPGRSLCQKHLDCQRAKTKAERLARVAAGLCRQCDEKPVKGQTRCERHRVMRTESREREKAAKFAARWEREQRRRRAEEGKCVTGGGAR